MRGLPNWESNPVLIRYDINFPLNLVADSEPTSFKGRK